MSPFRMGNMCVYFPVFTSDIFMCPTVKNCNNDLRINCSELIVTYFSFDLAQLLWLQVNRTSIKGG